MYVYVCIYVCMYIHIVGQEGMGGAAPNVWLVHSLSYLTFVN